MRPSWPRYHTCYCRTGGHPVTRSYIRWDAAKGMSGNEAFEYIPQGSEQKGVYHAQSAKGAHIHVRQYLVCANNEWVLSRCIYTLPTLLTLLAGQGRLPAMIHVYAVGRHTVFRHLFAPSSLTPLDVVARLLCWNARQRSILLFLSHKPFVFDKHIQQKRNAC